MACRQRVTHAQLETLYDFLSANKSVATGYNKSLQDRQTHKRVWTNISIELNSLPDGAVKNWRDWSKYWNDYKSKLKTIKLASARKGSTNTDLSDVERNFLSLLGHLTDEQQDTFDMADDDSTDAEGSSTGSPAFIKDEMSPEQMELTAKGRPSTPQFEPVYEKESRGKRATYAQLETLCDVMSANLAVATGCNKSIKSRVECRRVWEEVADKLNAMNTPEEGAVKDWKGWSKYWIDYKSKLKRKLRDSLLNVSNELTDLEKRFLSFLGHDVETNANEASLKEEDAFEMDGGETWDGGRSFAESPVYLESLQSPAPQELVYTSLLKPQTPPSSPLPVPSPSPPSPSPRLGTGLRSNGHRSRVLNMGGPRCRPTQRSARRELLNISRRKLQLDAQRNNLLGRILVELKGIRSALVSKNNK